MSNPAACVRTCDRCKSAGLGLVASTCLEFREDDDPSQLALHVRDAGVGCADSACEDVLIDRNLVRIRARRRGVYGVIAKRLLSGGVCVVTGTKSSHGTVAQLGTRRPLAILTGSRRFFSAQRRMSSTLLTFSGSHSVRDGVALNPSVKSWAWRDGWG